MPMSMDFWNLIALIEQMTEGIEEGLDEDYDGETFDDFLIRAAGWFYIGEVVKKKENEEKEEKKENEETEEMKDERIDYDDNYLGSFMDVPGKQRRAWRILLEEIKLAYL